MAYNRAVFITGSNRGLGLQFVKELAKNENYRHVFAACRKPNDAQELLSIAKENSKVQTVQLDVQNDQDIHSAVEVVNKKVGGNGLNLLINNAGISINGGPIPTVNRSDFMKVMDVNVSSPIMLTKAFYRLLRAASNPSSTRDIFLPAVVVNMSSILGSIESNNAESGVLYPYRCSKAALNMATKSMAIEFAPRNIIAITMHPGWVRTDLGGPKAPLFVEESIKGMMNVIENLNLSDSGKLLGYDGSNIPW
ncbi:putative oxidoreductase [Trichoplax sp. H2]|nr:putative oxidoreductase [Trichoplax sp. H2]|eukprot:RDD38058.1 putative oxidoreductase [Trichoplax sp. H2]